MQATVPPPLEEESDSTDVEQYARLLKGQVHIDTEPLEYHGHTTMSMKSPLPDEASDSDTGGGGCLD